MAQRLGDRLRHVHMTDGSGSPKDEHLVPGSRGDADRAAAGAPRRRGFEGHVVARSTPARPRTPSARESDLLETLAYTRLHFAAPEAAPGRPAER